MKILRIIYIYLKFLNGKTLIFKFLRRSNILSTASVKDIWNQNFKMERSRFSNLLREQIFFQWHQWKTFWSLKYKQKGRSWGLLFAEMKDLKIIVDAITSDLIQNSKMYQILSLLRHELNSRVNGFSSPC